MLNIKKHPLTFNDIKSCELVFLLNNNRQSAILNSPTYPEILPIIKQSDMYRLELLNLRLIIFSCIINCHYNLYSANTPLFKENACEVERVDLREDDQAGGNELIKHLNVVTLVYVPIAFVCLMVVVLLILHSYLTR